MPTARLLGFPGLLIALSLLTMVMVLVTVAARISAAHEEVDRIAEPAADLLAELQYLFARQTSSLRGYLISQDSNYLELHAEFRAREMAIYPELAEYVGQLPPDIAVAVAEVQTRAADWHRRLEREETAAAAARLDASMVLREQAVYRETLEATSGAARQIRELIRSRAARIDRIERNTRVLYGFLFLFASLMAIYSAWLYWRAERALASRDDVLAIVSHDLRNPVNRVRLAAEVLLERNEVPEDRRNMLDMVIRATGEMTRLIEDLLDVVQIEAGTLSIEAEPVALADLLDRLDESHSETAREKGVLWHVDRPSAPVTVQADEGRVLQALGNLVGNAVKFTPQGGEIRIEVAAAEDAVRIGVCDSGPGLDESQLAHAFDRFWQGNSSDRNGAGLGLEIARGIAEAHSGRLWLESEVGNGTRAWLELPLKGVAPSRPESPLRPRLRALNGALAGPVKAKLWRGQVKKSHSLAAD